jgi:uncharacterized caspase-like protein
MCAAAAFESSGERRKIALLIGNNQYKRSPLSNCVNDATDLSNELKRIGFYVTKSTDLIHEEMEKRIRQFANSIMSGDIVLFFYAGHGVQWEDQNYLIPCDNDRIENPIDYRYRATNAQHILESMADKKPFVIIYLLDCCREYCLPSMARNRGINLSRGMAPMSAVAGSLVAFACAPGKIAGDKALNGRNGVFTYHLLQHITKPGEEILNLMRDVTDGVANETNETQLPYLTSALRKRDIYLVPPSMPQTSSKIFPDKSQKMDFQKIAEISLNSTDGE